MAELTQEDQYILNQNFEKNIHDAYGQHRKPRGVAHYEYDYVWPGEVSFGSSLYKSLVRGFSSLFEYDGLPEEIEPEVFDMFLNQSGRMKIIKVGSKFYGVHITPKKFDNQGRWIETTIIEPWLPTLSGKTTEKFKNVEFRNNVLGESLIRTVHPYIEMIDDVMWNMDINQKILSGKFQYIIDETSNLGDNKEELNSLSQELVNGQPVILIKKSMTNTDGQSPLQSIIVQDATDSFIKTFKTMRSEMLNVIGIPNNNQEDKKERSISSEIDIQNIIESSILEDMLKWRQKGIDKCNEVFGWNASVKLREDVLGKIEGDDEDDNIEEQVPE